ncbi:MAG: DUF2520 domain-containing protein [Limnohabitans sp.]|nr:DUF2520 domain-containing protein [Limnohabitans sp.]
MISVVIIGAGNVAQHLISAFANSNIVDIIQIYSRTSNPNLKGISSDKITSIFSEIKEADLYIISVTDYAIKNISSEIPYENKLVVHTSGTVPISALNDKNKKGVFYPLQTFTKGKEVNFKEIPLCIEAENEADYKILATVANSISDKVFKIDSEQRKSLHVAAVFVCNFVNHLYQIGSEICLENNIPFEILLPLITETADKIKSISPADAQTGPAKRNDTQTINAHLNFLTNETQKDIYKLITKSIIDNGKKL